MTQISEPRVYGEIQVDDYTKNGAGISMQVENSGAEGYVLLPLQAYRGYAVRSEGGGITDRDLSRGEGAVVRVEIPAGYKGQISVRYAGFWYWRAAEAVSLATMLYLAWTAWRQKKRAAVAVEVCR